MTLTLARIASLHGTAGRQEAALWWGASLALILATAFLDPSTPVWVFLLLGAVNFAASTAMVRRLHDMGRSGWWILLTVVPIAGLIASIWILIAKRREAPPGRFSVPRPRYAWALGGILLFSLFLASRALWTPFWIPSGSMKPALLVGDYVITQRIAPERVAHGDIVTFLHPRAEEVWVKRVVGLAGDEIAMVDGVVQLNGQPLAQTPVEDFLEPPGPQGMLAVPPRCRNPGEQPCRKGQALEDNGTRRYPVLDIGPSFADSVPATIVPPGHMFVLGDNRDNANDSRFALARGGLGMVALENVRGRAVLVLFSSSGTGLWQVWRWRPERLVKGLQ